MADPETRRVDAIERRLNLLEGLKDDVEEIRKLLIQAAGGDDIPGAVDQTTWALCARCGHKLANLFNDELVLKYKDLYAVLSGGTAKLLCRHCGHTNVANWDGHERKVA